MSEALQVDKKIHAWLNRTRRGKLDDLAFHGPHFEGLRQLFSVLNPDAARDTKVVAELARRLSEALDSQRASTAAANASEATMPVPHQTLLDISSALDAVLCDFPSAKVCACVRSSGYSFAFVTLVINWFPRPTGL